MPIDYAQYPPNWFTEIRPRILDRESHCCKWCGVAEYAIRCKQTRLVISGGASFTDSTEIAVNHYQIGHLPKILRKNYYTVIVLSIAHLDHDHQNHEVSDDRLAAVCASCHFKYDAKLHYHHKKAREFELKHKDQFSLF